MYAKYRTRSKELAVGAPRRVSARPEIGVPRNALGIVAPVQCTTSLGVARREDDGYQLVSSV